LVFELPPGAGGTLHVELDRSRMQFGTYEFTSTENLRSAHVIIESLVAGETKVGDVVCTHATR
jgi:hypothetical protein